MQWFLPEHAFLATLGLALLGLRVVYQPEQWHGTHDFTIRTSFGLMLALTAFAFLARLPGIVTGTRGITTAALKEGGLAFHHWLPFALCSVVYENLHDLTYLIRKETYDSSLMAFDQWLFGTQPTLWVEKHLTSPLLTDVMVLAYGIYFFLPAALLLVAYRRADHERFRTLSVSLLLVFVLGFLSYILVPAIGPRFWLRDVYVAPVLQGHFFKGNATEVFNRFEAVHRDCFPSLHTALSGVALYYAWQWRSNLPGGRLWVAIYLPLVLSVWASTIYLRQHWVADVFAGWLLVALVVVVAPTAARLGTRKATRRPVPALAPVGRNDLTPEHAIDSFLASKD
jgi:membrane-associated phospholipid phosphatase